MLKYTVDIYHQYIFYIKNPPIHSLHYYSLSWETLLQLLLIATFLGKYD